jgi:hypothetical protein
VSARQAAANAAYGIGYALLAPPVIAAGLAAGVVVAVRRKRQR